MKYTTEILIEVPRERLTGLFESIENMYEWQAGLESHRVISGSREEEGCRSELVYRTRRGQLVMTETITRRALPEEYHSIYRAKGMTNECYNYFVEEPGPRTRWKMINILRFSGIMSLMAPFMKSVFEKNTHLNMERFRAFAERKNTHQ